MDLTTSPAYTLSFDERSNSFESPLSYHSEYMTNLGTTLITFKDGVLYTHDNDTYNYFYGVQYDSFITLVFNHNVAQVKSFMALDERSNFAWECPEIETSIMSYEQTPQISNLVADDFERKEDKYCAAFLKDVNSIGGIIEGDTLRGAWLKVKFKITAASELVTLNEALIRYVDSPLNS